MNILDCFFDTVSQKPDSVAVQEETRSITYAELNKKSDIIANYLQQNGYSKKIVGIYSTGTINHFISIIACMKIASPFININPNAPFEYSKNILNMLNASTLLMPEKNNVKQFKSVNICKILKNYSFNNDFSFEINYGEITYYVSTSGTTGNPQIVTRYSTSLTKLFSQIKMVLPNLFNSNILQSAPLYSAFSLDQSIILLFGGASIFFYNKEKNNIKNQFLFIKENNIDVAFFSTPIIKLCSRQSQLLDNIPDCLNYIIVGGEPLIVSAAFLLVLRYKKIKLVNNYGCTELGTMFFSTWNFNLLDICEYNSIPIGSSLPDLQFDMLYEDENIGQLIVRLNDAYEIYYNNNELNKAKIKYINGHYFFVTGDIVKKENDNYYIVGRVDNCVNIKGYRVELETIEKYISQILDGADNCVVVKTNEYKENKLFCFYEQGGMSKYEIISRLEKKIPEYMIPIEFFMISKLPRLSNGKIDRIKLSKILNKTKVENFDNEENIEKRIELQLTKMTQCKLPANYKECSFRQIGVDSLSFMDLICIIEYTERIMLDEIYINKNINTIGDFIAYVKSKEQS